MALIPDSQSETVAATARRLLSILGRQEWMRSFFSTDLRVLAWLWHHAAQGSLSACISSAFKSSAICAKMTGRIRLVFA